MSTFYQIKDQYEVPLGAPQIVVPNHISPFGDWEVVAVHYNLVGFIRNILTDGVLIYELFRREDKTDHWSLCRYNCVRMEREPLIEDVSLFHLACFVAKYYRELMHRPCFAMEDMPYDAPR